MKKIKLWKIPVYLILVGIMIFFFPLTLFWEPVLWIFLLIELSVSREVWASITEKLEWFRWWRDCMYGLFGSGESLSGGEWSAFVTKIQIMGNIFFIVALVLLLAVHYGKVNFRKDLKESIVKLLKKTWDHL